MDQAAPAPAEIPARRAWTPEQREAAAERSRAWSAWWAQASPEEREAHELEAKEKVRQEALRKRKAAPSPLDAEVGIAGFAMVSNAVMAGLGRELRGSVAKVYVAICRYAWTDPDTGQVVAKVRKEKIAAAAGCHRRTVDRACLGLAALGIVPMEHRKDRKKGWARPGCLVNHYFPPAPLARGAKGQGHIPPSDDPEIEADRAAAAADRAAAAAERQAAETQRGIAERTQARAEIAGLGPALEALRSALDSVEPRLRAVEALPGASGVSGRMASVGQLGALKERGECLAQIAEARRAIQQAFGRIADPELRGGVGLALDEARRARRLAEEAERWGLRLLTISAGAPIVAAVPASRTSSPTSRTSSRTSRTSSRTGKHGVVDQDLDPARLSPGKLSAQDETWRASKAAGAGPVLENMRARGYRPPSERGPPDGRQDEG